MSFTILFSFAHMEKKMQYAGCVLCTRFVYYVPREEQRDLENTKPMQTDTKVCLSGGKFCITLCVEPPCQVFQTILMQWIMENHSRNHGKNPGQIGISPSTPYSKHESFFDIFSTYLRVNLDRNTKKSSHLQLFVVG